MPDFQQFTAPVVLHHALIDAGMKYSTLKGNAVLASKELQVFLSFLCTRTDIEKYVEEFIRLEKKNN